MSTRSNTKKALEAARKAKIEEYYRDNALVDEAARIQHNDDIAEFSLFLDDKRNDIMKNPDFRPFIRFIRRILVHVAASADQGSGTMGCYASVITRMARSDKGKEIWRTRWNDMALHPIPQILPYIQKSPPAIILGDTQRKRRAHIERYAWGYVDKENDVKEMFIPRELVMAYVELEKSNACNINAGALVVLQTIILVVFIHELTHALTKWFFPKMLTPDLNDYSKEGKSGEVVEKDVFGSTLLCVEWLRTEYEKGEGRMKKIAALYSKEVRPSLDQVASTSGSPAPVPTGGARYYKLDDLKITLDSLDRKRIYNPAYVYKDGISDPDAGLPKAEYIRLRITHEDEPSLHEETSAQPTIGLGLRHIIVDHADRIVSCEQAE